MIFDSNGSWLMAMCFVIMNEYIYVCIGAPRNSYTGISMYIHIKQYIYKSRKGLHRMGHGQWRHLTLTKRCGFVISGRERHQPKPQSTGGAND